MCLLHFNISNAEVFYAQDEALKLAFPEATENKLLTFVLDQNQVTEIESEAKAKIDSKIISFYQALKDQQTLGYLAIDTHQVRTHNQSVMVVLSTNGEVLKTVILAFHEPSEYIASERWLKQFQGKNQVQELTTNGKIAGIVGSTLTTQATANCVRRVLVEFKKLILKN